MLGYDCCASWACHHGLSKTEPGHKPDEEPAISVKVTSFALGETDVTVGQWRSFVKSTGHSDGLGCAYSGLPHEQAGVVSWHRLGFPQGDDEPVACISWNEAQSYVRSLSVTTGRDYRLPTEAEWEYVARAGKASAYPWGETASHDWGNYGADTCCTPATGGRDRWTYTSPVRSFPPNAFGLYDMIGYAWQWTQDCYVASYTGATGRRCSGGAHSVSAPNGPRRHVGRHANPDPVGCTQLRAAAADDSCGVPQCRLRFPSCY